MKLVKKYNPRVWYGFGNRYSSLESIRRGESKISCAGEDLILGQLVLAEQTHSTDITILTQSMSGAGFTKGVEEIGHVDGFVSDIEGLFLVIKSADCTPILCYDKTKNVVGGVHSGRVGTRNSIIKALINNMVTNFRCRVEDIVVLVGPAIGGENYEVDEECFLDFVVSTQLGQEYRHIDMKQVIKRDLVKIGILEKNIEIDNSCTYADSNYFSYRRDKTAERQLAIIGIKDGNI